eukprot:10836914-Heterocapsa_arctica.AAC.1
MSMVIAFVGTAIEVAAAAQEVLLLRQPSAPSTQRYSTIPGLTTTSPTTWVHCPPWRSSSTPIGAAPQQPYATS